MAAWRTASGTTQQQGVCEAGGRGMGRRHPSLLPPGEGAGSGSCPVLVLPPASLQVRRAVRPSTTRELHVRVTDWQRDQAEGVTAVADTAACPLVCGPLMERLLISRSFVLVLHKICLVCSHTVSLGGNNFLRVCSLCPRVLSSITSSWESQPPACCV